MKVDPALGQLMIERQMTANAFDLMVVQPQP